VAAVQQENDRMRAEIQQVAAAQHQQQQLAAQLEANQQHLRQQQQHMSAAAPPQQSPPLQRQPKLPDLNRTLFYGKSGEDVQDWINTFKAFKMFYSLDAWQAIHSELTLHMKGAAFAWFEHRD
jgi:hypothetical protein